MTKNPPMKSEATPGREGLLALREIAAFNITPSTGASVAMRMRDIACNAINAATARLAAKPADEGLYLVWSNQHRCWWRANSHGYTGDVREAGRYSRAEAISISFQGRDGWQSPKGIPDEIAIAERDVPVFALSTTTEPKQ